MTSVDVIQMPDGRAIIQMFGVRSIPSTVNFGKYYDADCEITLEKSPQVEPCVLHRPASRRSATGMSTENWLVLVLKTDFSVDQLQQASIRIVRFGAELSHSRFRDLCSTTKPSQ